MSKTAIISIWLAAVFLVGCESMKMAEESDEAVAAPVNCATAEGDLRVLESEKAHVAAQKAAGMSTVAPASMVYGAGPAGGVTFEGASSQTLAADQMHAQLEIGRYEQDVNQKIAEIKSTCGL